MATVCRMRWLLAVVVVLLAACSDDESAEDRACEAWAEHREAVTSGELEGGELVEDAEQVAALAEEAGGDLATAGEDLVAAVNGGGGADDVFADFEILCA